MEGFSGDEGTAAEIHESVFASEPADIKPPDLALNQEPKGTNELSLHYYMLTSLLCATFIRNATCKGNAC